MPEDRPRLRELARRLGVEDGYDSALDGRRVETTDSTREAIVRAMGYPAESEDTAERALALLRDSAPVPEAPDGNEPRCHDADAILAGRSIFGIVANLYSVRSRRNWGFGHVGDLADLVERAAGEGAAFVGLNPLHATLHRPGDFSPYDPVSRLFRDPLYLDPERVPELPLCVETQRLLGSDAWRRRIETSRRHDRLDVVETEAMLEEALRPLHAVFRSREGDAADARRRRFAEYRAREGDALENFATFQTLADAFEAQSGGRRATDWADAYRHPDAAPVREFRERHAREVEWYAWLQFELDGQLADVAQAARDAGMPIGLYTDVALGSSSGGSDVWSFPDLFARGIRVGAPPDAFCPEGQDWSFPPLDPNALRRDGYTFWRRLLDANLQHAGALRLDHALALRRLFWIPEGCAPRDGAYVRYPESDLLAALAEAGRRHGALLIAEDLGTVPEGLSDGLRERGLFTSAVLLFERDAEGFRPASDYPRGCLATANTHDLPPLAALVTDADLMLRRSCGQIPDDESLERQRAERRSELRLLVERLSGDGWLREQDPESLAAAVTAFLASTPARLVGISLDDLAGEDEPINLPGVEPTRHPSWVRRMRAPLDAVFASPRARRIFASLPPERRSGPGDLPAHARDGSAP